MAHDRSKAGSGLHDTRSMPSYALGGAGAVIAPPEEDEMRRQLVVWTVVAAVLALSQPARAVQESDLDRAGLKSQAEQNKALARYLRHNGYPDVAQVRPLPDQFPWDDHEVTLYYVSARKEISFARARILGRPEIHTTRYERTMTDSDVRALQAHVGQLDAVGGGTVETTCTGSATSRAECAATRAENAADRIDVAAAKAEQAADKTEAIVAKMATHGVRRSH